MKKFLCVIGFFALFITTNACAQREIVVKEIYYFIDNDGKIDKSKKIKEREMTFHKERGCIRIENKNDFRKRTHDYDADMYKLQIPANSDKIYDENGRIIGYSEQADSVTHIKYAITYNEYDDPVEIKSVHEVNGENTTTSTLSFEYFYLGDIYHANAEKDNKKYFKLGIITSEKGCPWLLRTIKKDSFTVEFAERKYRN